MTTPGGKAGGAPALARMISQYGDVYVRALDWSCSRSSLVSLIRNGLDLGKPVTAETKSGRERNVKGYKRRHRIYDMEYSVSSPYISGTDSRPFISKSESPSPLTRLLKGASS